MAAGGGKRHRTRRMRPGNKMAGAGGVDLKPCGRIRALLKSGGRIVKPGRTNSEVKPICAEEAWIYIRGCRIEKAGLCFNSQGWSAL